MLRASLLVICILFGVDAARRPGRRFRGVRPEGGYDGDSTGSARAIPGEPGVDYPNFAVVPATTFTCRDNAEGFYADPDARCQVFHICSGRPGSMTKQSFLCPNGTIFNSNVNTCEWWNKVHCTTEQSDKEQYQTLTLGKESHKRTKPILTASNSNRPNVRGFPLVNEEQFDNENGDVQNEYTVDVSRRLLTTSKNRLEKEQTTENVFSYTRPFNDKYTGLNEETNDFRNSKSGSLSEENFSNRPLTTNTLTTGPAIGFQNTNSHIRDEFSNGYSFSTFPPKELVREVTIKPRVRYTHSVRRTTHNPLYSLNPIIHVARDSSLLSNFKNSQDFSERYLEERVTTDSSNKTRAPVQRFVIDGVLDQYNNSLDSPIISSTLSNRTPLPNNNEHFAENLPGITPEQGDVTPITGPDIALDGEIDRPTSSNFGDSKLDVKHRTIQTPRNGSNEEDRNTFSNVQTGNKQHNYLVRVGTNLRKYSKSDSSYSDEEGPPTIRVSSGYSFQSAEEHSKYYDGPKQVKVISSYSVGEQFPTESPVEIPEVTTANLSGNDNKRQMNGLNAVTPMNIPTYPFKEDDIQSVNKFEEPHYDELGEYIQPARHMVTPDIKTDVGNHNNEYSTNENNQKYSKEISTGRQEIKLLSTLLNHDSGSYEEHHTALPESQVVPKSNTLGKEDDNSNPDTITDHRKFNSMNFNGEFSTPRKIEFPTNVEENKEESHRNFIDSGNTNPTYLNEGSSGDGEIQFINRFVVQESDFNLNTPLTKVQNESGEGSSKSRPPQIPLSIDTITDPELNTYFPGIVRDDFENNLSTTSKLTPADESRENIYQNPSSHYLPTSTEPGLLSSTSQVKGSIQTQMESDVLQQDIQPALSPANYDIDIRIDRFNNNNKVTEHTSKQPFVINIPPLGLGVSQISNYNTLSSPPPVNSESNHFQSVTEIPGHYITEVPPQIQPFRFRVRTQNQKHNYGVNQLPTEFNNQFDRSKEEKQQIVTTEPQFLSTTLPPALRTLTDSVYESMSLGSQGNQNVFQSSIETYGLDQRNSQDYNNDERSLRTEKYKSPTQSSILRNFTEILVDKPPTLGNQFNIPLYNTQPSDQTYDQVQQNYKDNNNRGYKVFTPEIQQSSPPSTQPQIFKASTHVDKPSSLRTYEKIYDSQNLKPHYFDQHKYEYEEQPQQVISARTQLLPNHPVSTLRPSTSSDSTGSSNSKFTTQNTEGYINTYGYQSQGQFPSTTRPIDGFINTSPKLETFDNGSFYLSPIQVSPSSTTPADTERYLIPNSKVEGRENPSTPDQNMPANQPYASSTYFPETTKTSVYNKQDKPLNLFLPGPKPAFENSHLLFSDFPPKSIFYSLYPNYKIHSNTQAQPGLSVPPDHPSSTLIPIKFTSTPPNAPKENIGYETTEEAFIASQSRAPHKSSSEKPNTNYINNEALLSKSTTVSILPSLESYSTSTTIDTFKSEKNLSDLNTISAVSHPSSSKGISYGTTIPIIPNGNNIPTTTHSTTLTNAKGKENPEPVTFKTAVTETPTKVSFSTPTPFFSNEQEYFPTEQPADYTQFGKQFLNLFDLFNINSLTKSTYSSAVPKEESSPDIVKAISFSFDTPEDQKHFEIARSEGLLDS